MFYKLRFFSFKDFFSWVSHFHISRKVKRNKRNIVFNAVQRERTNRTLTIQIAVSFG